MGADGDPEASTINVKTSMVDPLGGAKDVDPRAPTINATKCQQLAPLAGADGDPGEPTINIKKRQRWAHWPRGGSGPHPGSVRCAVTCIGKIDKR
jgi:hypothetical protein